MTFGDSALPNYAWYTGVPYRHWQGEPPGNGTPRHPTRKIFSEPAVYEFAASVGGTYPPWYDPSYWYEGVVPNLSLTKQVQILMSNAKVYRRLLIPYLGVLFVGLLLLKLLSKKRLREGIKDYGTLIVPAFTATRLSARLTRWHPAPDWLA